MTAMELAQLTDGEQLPVKVGGFDYSVLDDATARFTWQRAQQIHWEAQRITQSGVSIGRMLLEVKERIPLGYWEAWLDQEFAWSAKSARRMMRAARLWGDRQVRDTNVSVATLDLIGHADIPDQMRGQLLDHLEGGQIRTTSDVVSFVGEASPDLAHQLARSNHGSMYRKYQQNTIHDLVLQVGELSSSVRNMQQALATEYGVPLKSVVADALQRLQRVSDRLLAIAVEHEPADLSKAHQGIKRGGKTSPFTGVSFWRNERKWGATITYHGKRMHLGMFNTEEAAARAYDAKARELHGDKARLNFPDD